MATRTACRPLVLLALLPLLMACSLSRNDGAEAPDTTLVVENSLIPSVSLTVYAMPASRPGSRSLVGSVNPGATTTLRFNPIDGGQYQFIAEIPLGNDIVSNPVSFSPGETIRWDLRSNILTVAASAAETPGR